MVEGNGCAGEIDRMGHAGDAGEVDRTEVLSEDQHPGGAGETDGMNELSEVVEGR